MISRAALALALVAGASPVAAATGDCETAYECARLHVDRGELEQAIELLEAERARAPADLRVLNLLGIALSGAGRVEEANQRFAAALESDPSFYPARKNLAINEFNRGRLEEAERQLEAVLAQAPDDDVAHLYMAEILFARESTGPALRHYEKSRARALRNAASTLHYARCLLAQGRRTEAVTALDGLLQGDPESRFQAGLALGEAGAHAEAARFFASARSGYRDPQTAGYNQVLMLVEAGDNDAALAAVEQLVAEGLGSADLLNLASRAHLAEGRVVEAYDALREATRLDPRAERNYFDLVTICLEHDNYDLGLEIVDIGLGVLPESLGLRLQRAVLLAEKGMVPAAEAEFEVARQLAPESPAPYVGLAMAWMQTGKTEKAIEVLRDVAGAKTGRGAMLSYAFGLTLVRSAADPKRAEGAEAVAAFEAAIRADPGFAPAHAELGKLLLKQGRVGPAVKALETAFELDPEAAGTAYMLARAYHAAGERERARELLASVDDRLRGEEPEGDSEAGLRRAMIRIVREGSAPPEGAARQR